MVQPSVKRICNCLLLLSLFLLAGCHHDRGEEDRRSVPLLLVSIDGFKPIYMEAWETPNLDSLASLGVTAESLKPVFPTKTFPTHYSIVTGLWPENSGVISNNMYDSGLGRFSIGNRRAVTDGRWYGGEPIWVTAEKQQRKTATLFWPGSEAEIEGIRPTRWMPYNGGMSHSARVDSIVSWLDTPDSVRPDFLTLYFSRVDSKGHRYGPESDQVRRAVEEIDERIGDLIDGLKEIGLWPRIHILIISDHGMTELSDNRLIYLDDLVDLDRIRIHDWSPVAMIQPEVGSEEQLFRTLKRHEEHYRVYRRENLPQRFRLREHHRVPELILIADSGYTITSRSRRVSQRLMAGAHGYDNRLPEMQGIFLAAGPDFRRGERVGTVDSIHLYELMTRLLAVEPAPNDGSLDSLRHLLRR